jgi:hypothetical protein
MSQRIASMVHHTIFLECIGRHGDGDTLSKFFWKSGKNSWFLTERKLSA